MAFRIIIKPIVWFDLEQAITWYEKQKIGLGRKFFYKFEEGIERIIANPYAYKNITSEVKRALLKNFPYKIFYAISENEILIIGVFHSKRSNAFVRKRVRALR